MKKIIYSAALIIAASTATAQVKMPAPSPTQKIVQDFGLSSIELSYSRPITKGRKIFGELVPYDKLWRTGANAATTIRFNDPVEIKGKKIDSGTYALYTIPHIDSWEIILNKGVKNWGIDGYKESEDVARFSVQPTHIKPLVESFTIQFTDIKALGANLEILWENTAISLPISAYGIVERIKAQLDEAFKGEKKPNWQAAQFYNEYDNNPKKALQYVSEAVKDNPKAFWVWIYKAKIELALGNKSAALESSNTSFKLATEAGNDDYVKMNEALQKKLK